MAAENSFSHSDFRYDPAANLHSLRLLRQFWGFLWRLALVMFLGYASYLGISRYIVQTVRVDGVSMYPTLQDTDTLFLNRWLYLLRNPRAGDIVVIKDPSDQGYCIKRVIAGPGDYVCVQHGQVFVNGWKFNEPYLPARIQTYPAASPKAEWMIGCQQDEYIVFGDNRGESFDSRYYGIVPRANILGAVFR